jgi:hypothetical protein
VTGERKEAEEEVRLEFARESERSRRDYFAGADPMLEFEEAAPQQAPQETHQTMQQEAEHMFQTSETQQQARSNTPQELRDTLWTLEVESILAECESEFSQELWRPRRKKARWN